MSAQSSFDRPPLCTKIGCPIKAQWTTKIGPRCNGHSKRIPRKALEE